MTDISSLPIPISENECFQIIEKFKTDFKFPKLKHDFYELHFIENGDGLRRIVGDSMEYIENYELILIKGCRLDHTWEQGTCKSKMIREIIFYFSSEIFSEVILQNEVFHSIQKMFKQALQGVCFPLSAIMKVYSQIDDLPSEEDTFKRYMKLIKLLHDISICEGIRTLASTTFSGTNKKNENQKITAIKNYINDHYLGSLTLPMLSKMADMTPVSFSRYFKQHSGKNISDYIIEIRLGYASRMLLDSPKSISEICTESGFKNLSNFNRIFKKKKGITPKVFRSHYKKNSY